MAMALVPKITSPCPLRVAAMPSAGRDFCGQCERRVHNLDGMDTAQRREFFAHCGGDVCVAYTVTWPQRLAHAARAGAMAAALGVSGVAAAQDAATPAAASAHPYVDVVTGPTCDPNAQIEMITVGSVIGEPQWLDESEVERPDPPPIAQIEAAQWLPTPAPGKR
jgi:hypothetical protein